MGLEGLEVILINLVGMDSLLCLVIHEFSNTHDLKGKRLRLALLQQQLSRLLLAGPSRAMGKGQRWET